MSIYEIWVRKNGTVAETERNPCGCCPDDYNFTDKPTIVSRLITRYIGRYSRKKLFARMKSLGYEYVGAR